MESCARGASSVCVCCCSCPIKHKQRGIDVKGSGGRRVGVVGVGVVGVVGLGLGLGSIVHDQHRRGELVQVRAAAQGGGLLNLGNMLFNFKGGDPAESTRQQYASTVSLINQLEPQISALSDSQLRDRTSLLRQRALSGESLDSLLPVLPNLSNIHEHDIPFF